MIKISLHWKILMAMFLGVIWSLLSGYFSLNIFTLNWINPFGVIFINLLKLIAIPLVLFSIVTGVIGLSDPSKLGRIGLKTLGLYLITTVFSVSIGLIIVNVFVPGYNYNADTRNNNRLEYEIWANENNIEVKDGRNLIVNSTDEKLKQIRSKLNSDSNTKEYKVISNKKINKNNGPLQPLVDIVPSNLITALGNGKFMLQVIFFALFFGIALIMIPSEKTKTVRHFFQNMNDIFIKMVYIVMNFAPFFVFCLMSGVLAKSADTFEQLIDIFIQLGFYSFVVIIGLLFMLFVFYPILLKIFGVKIGYRNFFVGMSAAQFLAFSTSSSAATLPVTINCVNNNLKIPSSVSDFVLPIGATVNMDGTSLYQAVAVIFLAQYHDVDLSILQQLGIVLTATLASIGSAAVPSAGLIMLMIVLDSVGLNPIWVAIVFPVDRILDMCRTVINVTSDATVSAIIAKTEKLID